LGICALTYLWGYHLAPSAGTWVPVWGHPLLMLNYFFVFLGCPLSSLGRTVMSFDSSGPRMMAAAMGICIFCLYGACCLAAWRWRRDVQLMRRIWPWLAIGNYGLASALLATTGRALDSGVQEALSTRYCIFGVCVMIALVHLVPILSLHRLEARPTPGAAKNVPVGLSLLGMIAGGCFLCILPAKISDMNNLRLNGCLRAGCLDFIKVVPPQPVMQQLLFPDYEHLRQMAETMDAVGALKRPLLTNSAIAGLQGEESGDESFLGSLESCRKTRDGKLIFAGWAYSKLRSDAADCVLLTCETTNINPYVFHLMDWRNLRPDLIGFTENLLPSPVGWGAECDSTNLPKGEVTIRAWGYDTDKRSAFALPGEIQIEN
jgi:hypothetical protein